MTIISADLNYHHMRRGTRLDKSQIKMLATAVPTERRPDGSHVTESGIEIRQSPASPYRWRCEGASACLGPRCNARTLTEVRARIALYALQVLTKVLRDVAKNG